MQGALSYLLGLAMFATLVVLMVGVISFAVHGDFYLRHANNIMRLRVVMQAIAVALLAAVFYAAIG